MRPTISLCCILKNEIKNLPQMLASVEGCFDEIHLTDTGSTDGSIEYIEKLVRKNVPRGTEIGNGRVFLHKFEWCNDFAAARNYSFSHSTTDYTMWLDLDDVLTNREGFIQWRDSIMKIADFWIATYDYASDPHGKPICSFARERVVKTAREMKWKYFVHEGITPTPLDKNPVQMQYVTNWRVTHKRTDEDVKNDRNRNLSLFKDRTLDCRMQYYYGKELLESGQPLEAFSQLVSAIAEEGLEPHDRIMGIQYACFCAMQLGQFDRAIQLAHQGTQLDPNRAEFYVIIGDSYLKLNRLLESVPFFTAATTCRAKNTTQMQGVIFEHKDCYGHYPLNQLARVFANIGDMDRAEAAVKSAIKLGKNPESDGILKDIMMVKEKAGILVNAKKENTEQIVISCHPQGFYEWDEEIYKTKGIGGSETAVVEMARWLSDLTNREVIIFNNRSVKKEFGKVKYLPAIELPDYFSKYVPKLHIAWRHNLKLTEAMTYLWCHDLNVPGIDQHQNYSGVLALSEFHKNFLTTLCGVPESKIVVTGNGIDPTRFDDSKIVSKSGVIWSSSPDRGLDRAIRIMDEVQKYLPDTKMHIYYGMENMLKMNKQKEVADLTAMMEARQWITYHGNVSQTELTKAMQNASVWLYPTNFLETYCITAVEAICAKTYPVVRSWGALPDTLCKAKSKGMALLLDSDCGSEADIHHWARQVKEAIQCEMWRGIKIDPKDYAWKKVAESWIEFFCL